MNINNNLNSMMQLEKKLEQSAAALAKLNTSTDQSDTKERKEVLKKPTIKEAEENEASQPEVVVKQAQMPIAYSVNANVISVQNRAEQTTLDIKA